MKSCLTTNFWNTGSPMMPSTGAAPNTCVESPSGMTSTSMSWSTTAPIASSASLAWPVSTRVSPTPSSCAPSDFTVSPSARAVVSLSAASAPVSKMKWNGPRPPIITSTNTRLSIHWNGTVMPVETGAAAGTPPQAATTASIA
jgi:hypothetical protein